jgi:hypothetical protein
MWFLSCFAAFEVLEIQAGSAGVLHMILRTDYVGGHKGYAAHAGYHLKFAYAVGVDQGGCRVGNVDVAAGLGVERKCAMQLESDSRDGRRELGFELR